MAMKLITLLQFDGQAAEAQKFYASLFADAQIEPMGMYTTGHLPNDSFQMHGILIINGQRFLCIDGTTKDRKSGLPQQSLYAEYTSEWEIDTTFSALSEGGTVLMPLKNYGFSRKFGSLIDKFGTSWQLNLPHFEMEEGNVCMANNKEVRSEYRN
jgi:predicted 3-demethylubiquinone-9 3-methyltransferase (glyoxalase superfamily)